MEHPEVENMGERQDDKMKWFGKYGRTVGWIIKWYGKKSKLKSEMICKIWKKPEDNCKKMGKIQKKIVKR
jgi:hypothetical protein